MKGFYSLLGIVYLISTSFYLAPKTADNTRNTKSTYKIETITEPKKTNNVSSSEELYNSILFDTDHKLDFDVFSKALLGFENLKKAGKLNEDAHLITICDFSMS